MKISDFALGNYTIYNYVDASYNYNQSYSATLVDASINSIVVGNKLQNKFITVKYSLTRGSGYRGGHFDILNDTSVLYMGPDYYLDNSTANVQDPAISFSTRFSSNNIMLDASINNAGSNATMNYTVDLLDYQSQDLIYSEYSYDNTTILTNNSSTHIVVGNKLQNRCINIDYVLTRNNGYRQGSFDILNDGSTLTMGTDSFIDNGVTEVDYPAVVFSKSFNENNIMLDAIVDSSGGNATMNYDIRRKMI
jgi:hypothetical protein